MKEDYKDYILEIGLPEGFKLLDCNSEILGWKAPNGEAARLGIISIDTCPIRMFVKVVGFEDFRAPVRSWGERRIYDTDKADQS